MKFNKLLKTLTASVLSGVLAGGVLTVGAVEVEPDGTEEREIEKCTLELRKYETDPYSAGEVQPDSQSVVPGAEFQAWRIMETNVNSPMLWCESSFSGLTFNDDTTLSDYIEDGIVKDKDALAAHIAEIKNYAFSEGIAATATLTDNGDGVYKTTVDEGVYLVVETKAPEGYSIESQPFLVALPQRNDDGTKETNVIAYPKDTPITIDKDVTDSSPCYEIGETIPFVINTIVPSYNVGTTEDDFEGGFKYEIKDEYSRGLTIYENSSLEVYTVTRRYDDGNGWVEEEHKVERADNTWTYTTDSTHRSFTVSFTWDFVNSHQGENIRVKYDGFLNENAYVGIQENGGNSNKVSLTYNNNPKEEYPEPKGDEIKLYTFGIDLEKTFDGKTVDDDPELQKKLKDVEFTLKNQTTDKDVWFITQEGTGVYTAYLKRSDQGEGSDIVVSDGEYKHYTLTRLLKPNSQGKLEINGLDAGHFPKNHPDDKEDIVYLLKETKTSKDYSLLGDGILIQPTYSFVGEPEYGAWTLDEDLNEIESITGIAWSESAGYYMSLSEDENKKGYLIMTVNNTKKQFDLPLTGSYGIFVYLILGCVIGSFAIVLITRKGKGKNAR